MEINNTSVLYHPNQAANVTHGLSPTGHLVVGIYLLFIGSLGFMGNVFFLIGLVKCRGKRTYHEAFLINLAVTDTGICLTGYPWAVASSFSQRWLFGDAGCQWYGFCGFFFGVASISTLGIISFDRFTTICSFNSKFHINSRKKVGLVIVGVWLYALFWSVAPLAGWGRYAPEPFQTSCTLDWLGRGPGDVIMLVCLFVCIIGLNVVVIGFSYGAIVCTLRKRRLQVAPSFGATANLSHLSHRAERKSTAVSFVVVMGFLLCWLPYAVFSFWYSFGNRMDIPIEATVMPALLAKSSSVVNPIIYVIASKKYRVMLIAFLCRKCTTAQDRTAGVVRLQREDLNLEAQQVRDSHPRVQIPSPRMTYVGGYRPRTPHMGANCGQLTMTRPHIGHNRSTLDHAAVSTLTDNNGNNDGHVRVDV